ncbi:uncharacterized protein LOC111329281 isoform X2 [Stylophora pistillata]|uniref:uncharacterized protein LOC111329281 isoform X2 n=1 Tax=Stylophora pistillata TaxID=50429 RepID=UPI000C038EDA|nr:uncharacterized protein LOC111329281 isoform X2 [Stylophora pistillata]
MEEATKLREHIHHMHGKEKKNPSEVQASREKFGNVSETEKLVGQQDIQSKRELTKSTPTETEEAEKLLGQQDKPEGELTESTTKECEGSVESIAQLRQIQLDSSKVNDKTDLKVELKKIASDKGFRIVDNEGSGNCMFYALSDQLEIAMGFKIRPEELRRILVQYLRKNPKLPDETDLFYFVDGHQSWADYLTYMEQDGAWGDHVILCAAANCYKTCIHVVSSLSADHDVILRPQCPAENSRTLMLGHIHEEHYVSLHSAQEAEKLVGQQDKPEGELTESATEESEEAQQQRQQYHDIIEKTEAFETHHKECIRVLPYKDKRNGQVSVELYVLCDIKYIPKELKEAARNSFEEMSVKLIWTNLYSGISDVPNITPGVSRRLEKKKAEQISKIIDSSLPTLFNEHRNITAVYPSLKVTDSKRAKEPCIVVNVLGKGRVPIGETNIPKTIKGFPVDIVEGFWVKTADRPNPIKPQKRMEHLCLGASIGIRGVNNYGTLGVFLKEGEDKFYLLSCEHVIGDVKGTEIIHPGWLHYTNSFQTYLGKCKQLLKRMTGNETELSPDNWQPTQLGELEGALYQVQKISDRIPPEMKNTGCYKDFRKYVEELKELVSNPPRVIATLSYGFYGNVLIERSFGQEDLRFTIDAAVAELKREEVEALKRNIFVQMIGTEDYPRGGVIETDEVPDTSVVREWCKSGVTTRHTLINNSFAPSPIVLMPERSKRVVRSSRLTKEGLLVGDPVEWESHLSIDNIDKPFSDKGDSGAVIFEKSKMSGFGIVVGVQYEERRLSKTIVSPLYIALETLSSLEQRRNLQIVLDKFG